MITVQIQTISSVKASDMNSKDGIFQATPSHSQPLVDAIKLRAVPIVDADSERFDSESMTYLTFIGSTTYEAAIEWIVSHSRSDAKTNGREGIRVIATFDIISMLSKGNLCKCSSRINIAQGSTIPIRSVLASGASTLDWSRSINSDLFSSWFHFLRRRWRLDLTSSQRRSSS